MRKLIRPPGLANVMSITAVFIALGATAYAATNLAKNSVGSKQIKAGAIQTSDLKNNAVTGKKAKESSFSQVPSANTANSAGTANVANSANSFGGMSAHNIAPFTLGNGGSQVIGAFGPFTLTASCAINQGGFDLARINITTAENNSAYIGEAEDADFDVGDSLEYVAASNEFSGGTGTPEIDEDNAMAASPSGTEILGHQLYAGVNILGQQGVCRFGGVVFVT
jgi:hypothetical protein